MCVYFSMNICLSATTNSLILLSLPTHNTSVLVVLYISNMAMSYRCWSQRAGLLMFSFGEICCCFTQEIITKILVLIFFGWRLCCGRVPWVAREANRKWVPLAVGLSHSRFSTTALPCGGSLLYHSFGIWHQYLDTEPRLKPPFAWTVCFQFFFF